MRFIKGKRHVYDKEILTNSVRRACFVSIYHARVITSGNEYCYKSDNSRQVIHYESIGIYTTCLVKQRGGKIDSNSTSFYEVIGRAEAVYRSVNH
jgi:hypothetical protein